ncbi:type II toxin-antitoxin system PemK/MazF family toxin [Listeria booriae]|uniref:type II toxin-antitoxin system PemK/MazF family toxin n=1 Tax=Listeria booriae TaxID=1552123 RepID=UPI00289ED00D|nr:type II toxin-antitoxin system PemK/MazF family toxin [Listeria booriae]
MYVGEIRTARFPYYDRKENKMKFKGRPVLVIGIEKDSLPCDMTVLPISRITTAKNINSNYDICVTKNDYPNTNLTADTSYIRTHKGSTVHSNEIGVTAVGSLKSSYPDLFNQCVNKYKEHAQSL